ncbi:MAG: MGH1-like glycoside hydrolase domain-containing protein [Sphaerochaetaceae bacterium]
MINDLVPSVHFYDQDFVDVYNRTWVWIDEFWTQGTKGNSFSGGYLSYPKQKTFNQLYSCMSALFLVYSNQNYSPFPALDFFYAKQTEDGAIYSDYSIEDGSPVLSDDNPLGVSIPLFAFVEHAFYHKIGNKKRLKEIVEPLEKHFDWLKDNFRRENGLYSVPVSALNSGNIDRSQVYYPVDFNAQLAVNALYMSAIGDILNDKELSFRYKRLYFSLKTRINALMWNGDEQFYFDLDIKEKQVIKKHIGSYWTLLAEIPNEERGDGFIAHLSNPNSFGTENPFPSIPVDDPQFSEEGNGFLGSVIPFNTFMVVKGLEQYGRFEFARECAIRHLYFILDTLHPNGEEGGDVWEAYQAMKEGAATSGNLKNFPKNRFLPMVGLATITLMIENIIGLDISLPRKTVDWTMATLETMGIEKLSLKRNMITILSNKQARGWEIRLESEKLYYFTIEILADKKKKTLPIPSGKCSMLIDKL